ncbi:MAG: hypothetical protein M1816_007133 [Peltula sp. TS41687]|nr:MAG: hypothetical protein M1816_007133 [Peltula sp. TS41687]
MPHLPSTTDQSNLVCIFNSDGFNWWRYRPLRFVSMIKRDMRTGTETIPEILGLSKTASKSEIKKAYHKAALSSHPDKVPENERSDAEVKFKAVSQAYEILYDDEKRHLYDTHGMSAFDPRNGGMGGVEVDLDDILQQVFGMGGPGMGEFTSGRSGRPRKGRDEEQEYKVTLEDLYKGKTTKFASEKKVVCGHCNGTGGKEKAKPKECAMCHGKGSTIRLRPVSPGLVSQETVPCSTCKGNGTMFKEKDRCKKCRGNQVVEQKKVLEIYIPRGSRDGDRIVLEGEADQVPNQQPGDIIFTLRETPHEVFMRAGADLQANLHITLAEALCGFSRVVLKHLDGRGIHINQPRGRILRPNQILKVPGEGMPLKKGETKGDLYLVVNVEFPNDEWTEDDATLEQLQKVLPKHDQTIQAEIVDEVEFVADADLEEFGAGSGDPRGGSGWVDEDDEDGDGEDGPSQCAQQ